MVAVGLIVDLMAGVSALDKADVGEKFQFALDGACARAGFAGDLADVEGLFGAAEEEREDATSGLAEEEIAECADVRTHYEVDCTLFED